MHPKNIAIADYTYELPEEKIARYPLPNRDDSKLLVYKEGNINTEKFHDLPQILPADCILVFNESSVIQSRLFFHTAQNHKIEIFCLEPNDDSGDPGKGLLQKKNVLWNCIVGNLKKWKDDELHLTAGELKLTAKIHERKNGYVIIKFIWRPDEMTFAEVLQATGNVPIPPYLNREADNEDRVRYQNLYSKNPGSVAAPTAGLHFTDHTLNELNSRGIDFLKLTLHVGAGTFKPVKSEFLDEHEMHAEWLDVERTTIKELAENKSKKVIAVGTTSLRTLESLYWLGVKAKHNPGYDIQQLEIKQWEVYDDLEQNISLEESLNTLLKWMEVHSLSRLICRTGILIAPPYQLKVATGLLTNFHQPQSTLLLLVAAITGTKWKEIYSYALQNDFRFLSYGDSSLLLK